MKDHNSEAYIPIMGDCRVQQEIISGLYLLEEWRDGGWQYIHPKLTDVQVIVVLEHYDIVAEIDGFDYWRPPQERHE